MLERVSASVSVADNCVPVSSAASTRGSQDLLVPGSLFCTEREQYSRQKLRRLQRSRLELSANRTASFIADCCNVCHAPENSLVLVPELARLRTFYFAPYKCAHVRLSFFFYRFRVIL